MYKIIEKLMTEVVGCTMKTEYMNVYACVNRYTYTEFSLSHIISIHKCMYACMYMYVYTYIHTYIHAYTNRTRYTHKGCTMKIEFSLSLITSIHTCIYACMYKDIYIYVYIHTHTNRTRYTHKGCTMKIEFSLSHIMATLAQGMAFLGPSLAK